MRIANRLRSIQASQTIALDTRAKELLAAGKPVINLTAGELDLAPHDAVITAAQDAAAEHHRYSAVPGIVELREAAARYLAKKYNCTYTANDIVVTNGAKQALYQICQTIVNPEDEVIVLQPGWVSYDAHIALAGGVSVPVETHSDNQPDIAAIEDAISKKTVAIIVNSPNNPTGAVYAQEALEGIAKIAREHDLIIISDEIYSELLYEGAKHVSLGALAPERTYVINGVSKSSAITGWRVGYIAGPVEGIEAMRTMQSHVTGNVNIVAQYGALEALQRIEESAPSYVAALAPRRKVVQVLLGDIVDPMQGAFYAWVHLGDGVDAIAFCEYLLNEHFVATVPGDYFGKTGYIRVSYARTLEEVAEAMQRIKQAIAAKGL